VLVTRSTRETVRRDHRGPDHRRSERADPSHHNRRLGRETIGTGTAKCAISEAGDQTDDCAPSARDISETSIRALTNATLPYLAALADEGWEAATQQDVALARGVNTHAGRVTNAGVAAAFGLEFAVI
jgi:hypothetical protein